MFLLKRIIVTISSILGACTGLILLALMNAAFHFNLTFSQVSVFGIIGGILLGIAAGYYIMYLIAKKARRFINNKLAGTLGKFGFLRRI
jgi:ABC-type antimicrobial peptide transport system permease subunit